MVILFTLWYVLGWQFPTWLWVVSGLFYLQALQPKQNKKKKRRSNSLVLPFSLALGIIFGSDALGNPILPESMSFWTIIGILVGSFIIRVIISRPDKIYKKGMAKIKSKESGDTDEKVTIHNIDDELKLNVKVTNKTKKSNKNFNVTLNNGFFKEKAIKKKWASKTDYTNDDGQPLFDIEEIYEKAKKNPIRGEILKVENDKVIVVISIQ